MESIVVTFDKAWHFPDDSVDGLLMRLDMGEQIPIFKFKEACKKEGRNFTIRIK